MCGSLSQFHVQCDNILYKMGTYGTKWGKNHSNPEFPQKNLCRSPMEDPMALQMRKISHTDNVLWILLYWLSTQSICDLEDTMTL